MADDKSENDGLHAEVEHWKNHAEEAGEGFARVCKDYARVSARNVALAEAVERAEVVLTNWQGVVDRCRALGDGLPCSTCTGRQQILDEFREALSNPPAKGGAS